MSVSDFFNGKCKQLKYYKICLIPKMLGLGKWCVTKVAYCTRRSTKPFILKKKNIVSLYEPLSVCRKLHENKILLFVLLFCVRLLQDFSAVSLYNGLEL